MYRIPFDFTYPVARDITRFSKPVLFTFFSTAATATTSSQQQCRTSMSTTLHAQTDVLTASDSINSLESGWYGFCLGGLKESCMCSLSLVVENDKKVPVIHKLPFIVREKPLLSINYGRLVYCKSESTIRLLRVSSPDNVEPQQPCKCNVHWKLIQRHKSSVQNMKGGELSDRDKCIACAVCSKTFERVDAAHAHHDDTHKVYPPDSIWIRPLPVAYQDADFAVVDKPQGISTQGAVGKTIQRSNLLLPLAGPDGRKPILVHRLDGPTGGLLVVAKNKESEVQLRHAFAKHLCKKRYRAVVFGKIQDENGVISEPISGKVSETRYQVIRRTRCTDVRASGWITTVDCFPVSGRRHQIRRHLKHIGHPIWGDRRYAWYTKAEKSDDDEPSQDDTLDLLYKTTVSEDAHARLCLWAVEISVPHPRTGATVLVTLGDEPEWITQLLEYQEKLYYAALSEPK